VSYTLLLADDSVTIQRVIELTFADEDVQVIAVSDGDQAIERLEASPPDIVLADIGMPGRNGYEVAQYMRQSPKLAHIPVVLLTGAFEPVDQARAAAAGCDGVLAKPFEPQLVIGRVKELLARKRAPASLDSGIAAPLATPADHTLVDQSFAALPPPPSTVPPPPSTVPTPPGELDDYFDRLDAAFSNLSTGAPVPSPTPPAASSTVEADIEINWFGPAPGDASPATEPWDLPAPATESWDLLAPATESWEPPVPAAEPPDLPRSYGSMSRAAPAELLVPAVPIEPAAPPSPVAAPQPVAHVALPSPMAQVAPAPMRAAAKPAELPSLADAFAALLAAEQSEPLPQTAPAWPASSPPSASVVTDDLIEDVTRRVLDRLSDQVVRETVADIVTKVAEHLVLEEIERIKASLK
jgi:CheY-like chemotaxis protein